MTTEETLLQQLEALADDSGPSAEAALTRVQESLGKERALTAQARQELADYIAEHPDGSEALQRILDKFTRADGLVDSIEAAAPPPPDEEPEEGEPTNPV